VSAYPRVFVEYRYPIRVHFRFGVSCFIATNRSDIILLKKIKKYHKIKIRGFIRSRLWIELFHCFPNLLHLRIILQHLSHIPSLSVLFIFLIFFTFFTHILLQFSLCLLHSSRSKTIFTVFQSKIWYFLFHIFVFQFWFLDVISGTQLGFLIKVSIFVFWVVSFFKRPIRVILFLILLLIFFFYV